MTRLALGLRCSDSLISDLRCDMCVARGSRSLRSRPVGRQRYSWSRTAFPFDSTSIVPVHDANCMTHVTEDAEHAQRAKNATEA